METAEEVALVKVFYSLSTDKVKRKDVTNGVAYQ